jgi:hypothetical protein
MEVMYIRAAKVPMLDKQVVYCLSHIPNSFCSGYFRDRVLLFSQACLDPDPTILSFLPFLG